MDKLKGGLIAVAALLGSAALCGGVFNSVGHTTRDNLDSLALVKSIDLAREQNGTIQSLAGTLQAQTLIITLIALAVLIIAFLIVRSVISNQKQHAGAAFPSLWAPTHPGELTSSNGPRMLVLGQPGRQWLASLPEGTQAAVLADLEVTVAELKGRLGYELPAYTASSSKRTGRSMIVYRPNWR